MAELLMQIDDLSVRYQTRAGWVEAVSNVSLDVYKGEVLGLVGESGCGKSTLGKALMRLLPRSTQVSGHLWFMGQDVLAMNAEELRRLRGRHISMIFQDPMTSLNPVQRVVDHLTETIRTHQPHTSEGEARERAAHLVDRLGIAGRRLENYPHQLSGGMRQRVMISLALALNADLIIADEATTSLDVIVEAQFMDLLRELARELNLTILLISHNIGLVAQLADRVAVMYAGRLAEVGDVYQVFKSPAHPYAEGLLGAVPSVLIEDDAPLYRMEGSPPDLLHPPAGCRFHPRCPLAIEACRVQVPALMPVSAGQVEQHLAACHVRAGAYSPA